MNKLKTSAIGLVLISTGIFGGVAFEASQSIDQPEEQPVEKNVEYNTDVKQDVACNYDPTRLIRILGSIDIPEKELIKLAPRDKNTGDVMVVKSLITENSIEKYFAQSVLDGRPAVLGGSLNSVELQKLYEEIARKNGILNSENIKNGEIDIYNELRK